MISARFFPPSLFWSNLATNVDVLRAAAAVIVAVPWLLSRRQTFPFSLSPLHFFSISSSFSPESTHKRPAVFGPQQPSLGMGPRRWNYIKVIIFLSLPDLCVERVDDRCFRFGERRERIFPKGPGNKRDEGEKGRNKGTYYAQAEKLLWRGKIRSSRDRRRGKAKKFPLATFAA